MLAALPREEYERLLPRLELVRFPMNRILYEAGEEIHYAYSSHMAWPRCSPSPKMAPLWKLALLYPVTIVAEVVLLRRGQRALLSGGR